MSNVIYNGRGQGNSEYIDRVNEGYFKLAEKVESLVTILNLQGNSYKFNIRLIRYKKVNTNKVAVSILSDSKSLLTRFYFDLKTNSRSVRIFRGMSCYRKRDILPISQTIKINSEEELIKLLINILTVLEDY